MEFAEDLEDGKPGGHKCERCDRACEPMEMATCSICKRRFCPYCAERIASRNFCSRACGEAYFFGDEEDVEGAGEE